MLCMIVSIVPINAFATDGAESLQSENVAADSVINTEEELAAAVAAGGEVALGGNITLTEALVIPADVTVTLDLNGKIIDQTKAQTAAYSMIVNNGTLTIKDSKGTGKIQYTDSGNGGEYVSNTILNNGTLTVKSGTIENLSSATVANNGYPQAIDTNGKLTVENGAITSANYSAIRIWCTTDDNTSVAINGGIITGSVDLHNVNGNANKGTLTITGGTFNQNDFTNKVVRLVNFGTDIDELKIDVKGGTFNGVIGLSGSVKTVELADVVTVYGGKFPADFVVAPYLADGVTSDDQGNVAHCIIDSVEDLEAFAAAVNGGKTFAGETVKLTADIDLSTVDNWTPIGNDTNYFWGTFDGQGHTISNMTINVNTPDANQFVGLFGGVRKATLKNFKMTNVNIDVVGAKVRAAAVVGIAHSNSENHTTANINLENITVDGCVINAEAKSNSLAVGGLSGYCYPANMTNISVSNLTINPKASSSVFAGGLVGYMQGQNISNNGNTRAYYTVDGFTLKNITINSETNDSLIGGFAGYTYYGYITLKNATIEGFKVKADVAKEALVGGLIGLAHRSDKGHTFTDVEITGIDFDITSDSGVDVIVGGMVGYSGSPIAYANSSVSGTITETVRNDTSSAIVGGFVGQTASWKQSYEGCAADVDITASNIAGGFVGYNGTTATYTNCEAKGSVEANTAGGFAGGTNNATYINCSYTGESDVPFLAGHVAQVGTTYYKTLAEAIAAANEVDGGATVTLLADVTLDAKLTISGNVTISGEYTITRADTYTGTLFAVNAGATLTLDGGLVIDGNNNYAFNEDLYNADLEAMVSIPKTDAEKYFTPEDGKPVATAYMIVLTQGTSADAFGGTVNLNNVTIQNNYSVNSGIVNAAQYTSTVLNGAKITHVAATQASGVVVNASGAGIKVNMNEGTVIDGNHVGGNHGIFKIYSGAVFTMDGGEVKNTTGWNSNGSVVGLYGGTFIMNGGTICSNSAVYGPSNGRNAAIYLHSNSVMEMNDGTICHNTGRSRGGIDSSQTTSKMTITGGFVLDNISVAGNSTADIGGTVGTWEITGGTFTQDVSAWLAPDTGLVYDEATGTYTTTAHVYNLWFRDPVTGEQVKDVGPLQGDDPASLVATGKLFYAGYYVMELEVLSNAKIDAPIVIDYPMTVNLNGYTLTGVDVYPVIRVQGGAGVVVKNGTINNDDYVFVLGASDGSSAGNLTIESGKYHGDTTVASVTKGTLTIEGGEFSVDPYEGSYAYLINCIDANYKAGSAKVEIKGGTFYNWNPADNAAENPKANFCADGYLSEEIEAGVYGVRVNKDELAPIVTITFTDSNTNSEVTLKYPSERFDTIQKLIGTNDYADFVLGATQSELLAYIADGRASNIVITLHEDIELDAPLNFYNKYFQIPVTYDITINGQDNKITWADGYTGTLINVESGVSLTMKYVTIDGENKFEFYEDTTTVENGQNWYTRFVNVGDEDKAVNANVIVNAGDLKLLNGFKIKNVTIASDSGNGKTENTDTGYVLKYNDDLALIYSNGGTVTIEKAWFMYNAGLLLNAVNATTVITDNTAINFNMGCGNKGGLIIANGGTMEISDWTSITKNKAMARSATILGVINGAEVTFSNGNMSDNKHIGVGSNTAGAMIVLEGASQFVMNGGSISGNIGGRAGAIASRWVGGNYGQHEETSIVLNAGYIGNNTASNDSWNGADIFLRSPATIGEGMKVDGTIAVNAAPAELDITGGTFTKFNLIVTDGLSAEISGGTFDADPSEWLVDGYVAPKNDQGLYAVEDLIAEIIFSAFGGTETRITYPGYADSLQELVDYYMFCNNANEIAIPGFSFGDYTPVLNIVGDLDAADVAYLGGASTDGTYVSQQPMTWTVKLANADDAANIKAADGYMVDLINGVLTVRKPNYVATVDGEQFESLQAAVDAADAGDTVVLLQNVELTKFLSITKSLTLDLAGKTITRDGGTGLYINGTDIVVTIEGEGTVQSSAEALFINAGTVKIENGTFKSTVNDGPAVYVINNGHAEIYGGTFSNANGEFVLNEYDKTRDATTITVYGGTFYNFDPENNASEGAGTNFVHKDYISVDNGDNSYTVISYVKWVKEQLLAGNSVTLDRDIVVDGSMIESIPAPTNGNGKYPNYGIFNVVGDYDVTFDLNGHSITYNGHKDFQWNGKTYNSCTVAHGLFYANAGADLTVKDSVGTGKVTVYGLASGAYVASPDTTFTITGGTWKNEGCATCGGTNIFLYPLQGGELYIKGGHFDQALDAEGESYLIVEHGGSYANSVIDYSKTKVVISGGTFVGMNPEEIKYFNQTADNTLDTTTKPTTNGCELGYMANDNGDGTYGIKEWDLVIRNTDDLLRFAAMVNAGNTFAGKVVNLMADIDLGGMTWTPLSKFAGKFYGNNHGISNFHIDATSGHGGFFNVLEWATVEDLTLEKVTATVGAYRFGTLARSINQTNIDNVTVKNVKVTTTDSSAFVAGLFCHGTVNSNMEVNNCTVEDLAVNAEKGASLIAGITTFIQKNGTEAEGTNILENLHVKNFTVVINDTDGVAAVGGLVGQTQSVWQNPRFNNCSVSGLNVTASGEVDVGGFICYPGSWTYAENCSVEGKIDVTGVTSASNFAGGFFGDYGWGDNVSKGDHKVTSCIADVDIITKVATAGGFVGSGTNSENRNKNITLTDCEAKGTVTCVEGGTATVGGFAGNADRGTYKNCSAAQDPFIGYVYAGSKLVNENSYVASVGEVYYTDFANALAAAKSGDVKTIVLHAPVVITEDTTLDLTGLTVDGNGVYPAFRIQNGANVTVKGGTVTNGDYVFVLGASDGSSAGNLTIESGSYTGTTTVASVTKGTLTIEGGEFKTADGEYGATYLLNCIDANYKDGSASIIVKGGRFYGFNPENNAAEGAGTNFVAEGYISEADGDSYTVRKLNYVAEVNGVKYESLQAAINACKNGETVKLIADITYDADDIVYAHGGATGFGNYDHYNPSIVYVGGTKGETPAQNQPSDVNVVIDLNGHTVTNNANAYLFLFMDNCQVTFTDSHGDGKIISHSTSYPSIWACGTDTLVTIKKGYYETDSALGLLHATHSGDLVIYGGEFKTTAEDASLLIMLNSQKYNNPNYFLKGIATVTIYGGIFHGFNPKYVGDDYGASSIDDIKFVDGCGENYEPVDNGDGTYGVIPTDLIKVEVEIMPGAWGTSYITVENWDDLVAALGEYTNVPLKITLLEDVELPDTLVIKGNKSVVIDLNGKTLKGMLENHADLTVNDTVGGGKIDGGSEAAIDNYGVLTVNGGSFSGAISAIYNNEITDGKAEVTINGGEFTAPGDYCATIENRYGILTVNGGKIVATNSAGYAIVDTCGETTINDGKIISAQGTAVQTYQGKIVIKDGSFVGKVIVENQAGNVTVYGGTLVSNTPEYYYGLTISNNGSTVLYGGTYERDYATAEGTSVKIADGYRAVENSDGTWTVKKVITVKIDDITHIIGNEIPDVTYTITGALEGDEFLLVVEYETLDFAKEGVQDIIGTGYVFMRDDYVVDVIPGTLTVKAAVAEVNGTYYPTLQAAIEAAEDGDTITFLADITEIVTVSTKVTIDGADFTYTGAMTLKADTTIKNVNFDGKGYNGYAVETRGADYLTIEDCTAKNYGYGFVQLASGTALTTVKNVTVSNMNYGVKVDYSNAVVLENVDITAAVAALLNSNYGSKTITVKDSYLSILGTWTRNDTIKTTYVFEGDNTIDEFVTDAAIDSFKLAVGATLTAPEGQTVTTDAADYKVVYENGIYKLVAKNYVAEVNGVKYESLQEAIDACVKGDNVIKLLANTDEDVTIKQTEGVNITIDGQYGTVVTGNYDFRGTITIHGNARSEGAETLTIKYIDFITSEASHYFIDSNSTGSVERYAHNVTISDCTFKAEGAAKYTAVAVRIRQGFNITIEAKYAARVTAQFMHSLFQGYGCNGVTFNRVNVNNMKNGISVGTSKDVVFNTVQINAEGYGIRVGDKNAGAYETDLTLNNVNITAELPVVVRYATGKQVVTFTGTNDLNASNTNGYEVIFTNGDDGTYVMPTGEFKVTGADNFTVYPICEYPVAIGDENGPKYESLQAAIEAAKPGETVILLKDIDLTEADRVVGADRNVLIDVVGKDITLDMNGKKISVVHEDAFTNDYIVAVIRVADGAGLTVTGDGTIDVKVLAENPDVAYMFWKRGTTGHLTIENGTYHMNDAADSMVYTNGNEIVTIEGGTFTLDNLDDENGPWIFNVQGQGDKHVIVTGGTFNADINRQKWSSEVLVPETYYTVANGDDTWTVKEGAKAYVATGMLNGPHFVRKNIGYATFEEALAAAIAYDDLFITLLADYTADITLEKAIKLDTNGYAIGKVVLADAGATVLAPADQNVITTVAGMKVVYEEDTYKVAVLTYVAQIGDTKYETLQAAVNAAQDGDVITLLENIELTDEVLTISRAAKFSIDLNGHTITGTVTKSTTALVFVTGGCDLTLLDSSDDETGGIHAVNTNGNLDNLIRVETDATLVIESGNYTQDASTNGCGMIDSRGDEIITIKGGNFRLDNIGSASNGSPWIFNASSQNTKNIIVQGGTFNADIIHQYYPFEVMAPKELALVKGVGDIWYFVPAVAYVNEQEWSSNWYTNEVGYATFEEAIAAVEGIRTKDGKASPEEFITLLGDVMVTGDVDTKGITIVQNGFAIKLAIADATLTAVEGLNVTTDIADHEVAYADGKYYVEETKRVAKIGDVEYKTLQAAINAAKADDTIVLIANVTEDVTVNESIIIDGGSFTYTGKISISGDVNVTIQNVKFVKGSIEHSSSNTSGNLTVKGCSFADGGYAVTTSRINSVTIEGCTVTNQSLLYAKLSTLNVVVKNVTVSGGNYVAHLVYGDKAYFENVTATAMTGYGIYTQNYGAKTITLKNCSFETPKYDSIAMREDRTAAVDTFIFEGQNTMTSLENSEYAKYVLAATDATLTAPEGYDVTTNVEGCIVKYVDGAYKVVEAVAAIGDTLYETLQDAINAAKDGDTIVILKDIDLAKETIQSLAGKYNTYFLVEEKSVIIDLNEKTISGEYTGDSMLVGVFSTDNNGKLTLTGNGTIDVTAKGTVYGLLVNYEAGCSITIENGTYKLDKASDSLIYSGSDETVTVNGGTFHLGNVGTGSNGSPWIFNAKGQNEANIIVNGGTFNADIIHQYYPFEVMAPKEKALKNNGDGTWTMVDAVAYVNEQEWSSKWYTNEVGYATFEEAYAAVEEYKAATGKRPEKIAETITLLKDVTIEIDMTKNVTIKKGNNNVTVADGVKFYAGTYDWDVSAHVPEAYYALYNESTKLYTVRCMLLAGTNVAIGNYLGIGFYYDSAFFLADEEYYVEITHVDANGNEIKTKYVKGKSAEWTTKGSYNIIKYHQLAAKEMSDKIYIQVFYADGTPASVKEYETIAECAYRYMVSSAESNLKLSAVYVDLLNYGAAAQQCFNYNTDELANAKLEDYQKYATTKNAYVTDENGNKILDSNGNYVPNYSTTHATDDVNAAGTSLLLKDNIVMKMFFEIPAEHRDAILNDLNSGRWKAYIDYVDHNGNESHYYIPSTDRHFTIQSGYLVVVVDNLALADFAISVKVTITDTTTTEVIGRFTYSMNDAAYAGLYNQAGNATYEAMYEAILKLGYSSYNYYH